MNFLTQLTWKRNETMKKQISKYGCPILMAGFLCFSLGCKSIGPIAKQEATYPKDKVDARALFNENCATCHDTDGRARTFHGVMLGAQNFTDPKWRADASDAEVYDAIMVGPGAMPAFGKKLSSAEIAALAAYVRTFKPE
jgi:mono/diheme cytochrome c family protein